jgi:putative polyketide hydroxylase
VHPGISTLDLLGTGFTLLTGQDGSVWRQAAAAMNASVPVTVEPLAPEASMTLGIDHGGALLVRPDGQVLARMPGPRALPDAVADLTGVPAHAALRG